jgi:uncharacterized membrane protein
VSIEPLGIMIVTSLFAFVFDHAMGNLGVVAVLGATAATA